MNAATDSSLSWGEEVRHADSQYELDSHRLRHRATTKREHLRHGDASGQRKVHRHVHEIGTHPHNIAQPTWQETD